jgi:membrane protease YdiL (CAAX protease family)
MPAPLGLADRLAAALGPGLLLAGAMLPALRPPVALLVVLGWLLLRLARRRAAIAWAAVLPVAVVLVWPWVLGPDVAVGDPACRDPLSAIASHRVLVAAAGLALVAGLAAVHASGPAELGLRRPGRLEAGVALGAGVLLVAAGLFVGPAVARPFFGELDFPVPLEALLPAAAFGLANGGLEELLYRGAMQAWLARLAPVGVAIAVQGLAFGIAHVGPEVVDLVPVHVALLTSVGVTAGLARWRFGSLWIPIGIHVGADVALYVGLACRAAP